MLPDDIAFGPIPSRRLGHSLGINNIPGKLCSYGCTYCQVGLTTEAAIEPREIYDPEEVAAAIEARVARLRARSEPIDYLSIVPDGEPTLDLHLGRLIDLLKPLGIPVAVISNGTLLGRAEVRERLARADLVSLKIDTVDEAAWRRIDHPHRRLSLAGVLAGIERFAGEFRGTLITETMLQSGVNDDPERVAATADFIASIAPETAYLAVPTRPPADAACRPPSPPRLAVAAAVFRARLPRVVCLTGKSGSDFAASGDPITDILAIAAVHPIDRDAAAAILAKNQADWSVVEALLAGGELVELDYDGRRFYARPAGRLEARDERNSPNDEIG